MKYTQGDIVLVNFLFPNGAFKEHFAIIVSNDELQKDEGFLYLVMISSKNYFEKYAYELEDNMLTKALPQKSYVKCQLLTGFTERDILTKFGKVKQLFLDQIIDKVINSIF
jgi:mRNA-degrading endonuclease toxin of MazEF toxin-antitoxin module